MTYAAFDHTWTLSGSSDVFVLPKTNYWGFLEGNPRRGHRTITFRADSKWYSLEVEWVSGRPMYVKYTDAKMTRKDYLGVIDVENVTIRPTPTSLAAVHPHHRTGCKLLKLFAEGKLPDLEIDL